MSRKRSKRNKSRSLYIWHRYAGLFAALFVIFLSVTGIALNHTDTLKLKKHHISSSILLNRYNIQAPSNITHFEVAQRSVIQAGEFLFINQQYVSTVDATIIGVSPLADFLIVATSNKLLVIDINNQLVETLREIDQVPNNLSRIGSHNKNLYVQANNQLFNLNDEFTIKKTEFNQSIEWSTPSPLSQQDETTIIQRYKSNIISLETVMLDIHSGRFFGAYGALFFDFVGIILIFLATTGIIIWLRQRPEKNEL
jgi:hypothetical protein